MWKYKHIPNKLLPKYYKLRSKIKDDIREAVGEWKKFNIHNIVLIGRTGSGKSTLANVLTNSYDFIERTGQVTQTHKTQFGSFTIGDEEYRVFDTMGFEDTYGTPEGVIIGNVQAAVCQANVQGGIKQLVFVNQGQFTSGEIKMYNLLTSISFDSGLADYITIVRTNFPNFTNLAACEEDTRIMIDSGGELGNIIKNHRERIIHVNNDHHNKEAIAESRRRLLDRLGECYTAYHDNTLANKKLTQDLFKVMMWTRKKVESEGEGKEKEAIICEKIMNKPKEILFKAFQSKAKDYNMRVKDSDIAGVPVDSEV